MKQQIRKQLFETNSSSVHSLVVDPGGMEKSKLKQDENGYIHVKYGEFGKEFEIYNTQEDKLSYIISLMWYLAGRGDSICYFSMFKYLEDAIKDYTGASGLIIEKGEPAIDHQSIPDYARDCVVDLYDTDAVMNFVFNKYVCLKTTCD